LCIAYPKTTILARGVGPLEAASAPLVARYRRIQSSASRACDIPKQGRTFEGRAPPVDTQPVTGTVPTKLSLNSAIGFTVALQKRTRDGELGIKVAVAYTHRSSIAR